MATDPDSPYTAVTDPFQYEVDPRLPKWARRSNPIIKRHLGDTWRSQSPDMEGARQWLLIQIGLIGLTVITPIAFLPVILLNVVSLWALPVAFALYGMALFLTGHDAIAAIDAEQRSGMLTLLRTTPCSLKHILYSKVAGSMWRQAHHLGTVATTVAYFSLPVIAIRIAHLWPPETYPLLSRIAMIGALLGAWLRVFLEPAMIGAMGVLFGVVLRSRPLAAVMLGVGAVLYFLIINMLRLLVLPCPAMFFVEVVLPVIAPPILAWIALQVTAHILQRD